MRVCSLLITAALAVLASACRLPSFADIASDPSCHRDPYVDQTDIFVITARGFRCRSSTAQWGPYRQMSGVNFGRSSMVGPFSHGESGTALVDEAGWKRALKNRPGAPIIFIHGYNNDEHEAVRRARAIASLLIVPRPVIAVTWPSYAKLSAVSWDEANNEWAREALSSEIAHIVSERQGATLIAHSMGNRILLDFLENHPEAIKNINAIIFAAPDVDEDQFMRHMQRGKSFGPPVTIYASTKDQALAASWRVHGMRRAGDLSATAHSHERLIRYGDLDPSVTVIDLSRAKGDPIAHSNFIQSPLGAADLCRVLNAPINMKDRHPIQNQYFLLVPEAQESDTCDEKARDAADIDKGKSPPVPIQRTIR